MNGEAIEGVRAGEAAGSQEPLYFPSGDHMLFAWLHHPAQPCRARWGVVICKAFGYEALCAHRSVRTFADAAAALGVPVLRFDYLGCGDSADIDPGADQLEAWTQDIVHAVAELRRRTGVERVCLLGFRLGALLATLAAERCQVEALAMVAPVLSGRRFLKEARTLELAASAAAGAGAAQVEIPASNPGDMEVSGYPLTAASMAALARTDVAQAVLPAIADVLLIDRSDLPVGHDWAQRLTAAGSRVTYRALPGFVEMMMTSPQYATIAPQMLQASRQWLADLCAAPSAAPPAAGGSEVPVTATAPSQELLLPGADDSAGARITEQPVFLCPDGTLFGIVTAPRRDENRRRAVILLNTGADHHIGASRMYVSLARRWARRGYYVLRIDLSGLGDSRARPGQPENEVFPSDAVADIRSAVEHLRGRYGVGDVTLLGLCSGAYHALRAAGEGLAVRRILMVNPENFFWEEGMSVRDLQPADVLQETGDYRKRALSPENWRRLLKGQIDVTFILKVILRRLLIVVDSAARRLARLAGVRLEHDLGRELERIVAGGVRIVMVFAPGEAGFEVLKIQAGAALKRLGDRLAIRVVAGGDHTFSRSGPRKVLESVLSEELFAR
jgi:alpha-beta hydrolase superfamily lysophospholipase